MLKAADAEPPETHMLPPKISLVRCESTALAFRGARYDVAFENGHIRITDAAGHRAILYQKSQQVAYKSQLLGCVVLAEDSSGDLDFARHLSVTWEDDCSLPELVFSVPPREIVRSYRRGQTIELGLEPVDAYCVTYADGVQADFLRGPDGGFRFVFSTGFYGDFETDGEGGCTLHFKGDRLAPSEEAYDSQSKFIVSRSKYSRAASVI